LSRQSITDPSTYTKIVTSQGPEFVYSSEQSTENPRVENTAITPVNMNPEGFDLIGDLFMSGGFLRYGDIPVFLFLIL
jgi:hypothetical protein